jgi:hypothetical protein
MINGISPVYYGGYPVNPITAFNPTSLNPVSPVSYDPKAERTSDIIRNPSESTTKAPGRKSSPAECETCKNRKYQDGSNENVSYKTAQHISPESAASAVRAHEQEHVSNAYTKAAEGNGTVVSASVSIQTAICPECGRSYVSGGTTNTQIKYTNEENPYQQNLKQLDAARYTGMNVDIAC